MSQFTLTLDASQLYQIQVCPLKWYYDFKERLQLSGKETTAPDKGTLMHLLLDWFYTATWDNSPFDRLPLAERVIMQFKEQKETLKLFPKDDGTIENFICNRFFLYINRYMIGDFILPETKTSPVEVGFSKLLIEDNDYKFIVEGRIDLINKIQGGTLCWTDHKTQYRAGTLYKYKPQFKTYAWATGYEYGQVNYIGIQEDKNGAINKNGRMFHRDLIHFPKWMIDEWENDMIAIFMRIARILQNPENYESLIETRLYMQRNTSSCGGPFDSFPCQFTHLCEEGDWDMKQRLKEFKYHKKEPWTPWSLKEVTK